MDRVSDDFGSGVVFAVIVIAVIALFFILGRISGKQSIVDTLTPVCSCSVEDSE